MLKAIHRIGLVIPFSLTVIVVIAPHAAAITWEDCQNPAVRKTGTQMDLCLQYGGYLDRFNDSSDPDKVNAFDMGTPVNGGVVQNSYEALAAYDSLSKAEGRADIEAGRGHTAKAHYFRNSNFHNNQVARKLEGTGPIEMPSSMAEVSSNAIDIVATGPTGSYFTQSGIHLLFLGGIIAVFAIPISGMFGVRLSSGNIFMPLALGVLLVVGMSAYNNGDLTLGQPGTGRSIQTNTQAPSNSNYSSMENYFGN